MYAGLVVGALVFSVSTQGLAVCLHNDVVMLFIVTNISTGQVARRRMGNGDDNHLNLT